ncbi:hypothetical protein DPX16_19030 [Anabarilius grahami]|uniref:Uncharacterized protein n=1 Tax=Anabarilius grahami TaxID=495550 RepID=A0A3N0YVJ9_ANAGA|nr:hypothetical protein DPX16_19030 [Anabarilius grahami]
MREQLQKNTKDNTIHLSTAPTTDYTNRDSEPATNTQTPAETQTSPAHPPEPDPDVPLLMDSNGKFLDHRNSSHIKKTLPAHPPLHAQTHPSVPGEERRQLDKHPTSSTTPTPTYGSLHTCKLAITNFTSTCWPSSPHQEEETKAPPHPHQEKSLQPRAQSYAEAVPTRPPASPTTATPASELSQIREMLRTLCDQLLSR